MRIMSFIFILFFFFHPTVVFSSPNFKDIAIKLSNKKKLDKPIENAITYLFAILKQKTKKIHSQEIVPLLNFSLFSDQASGTISIKARDAEGAFLREKIDASYSKVISYFTDETLPQSILQPSGLRSVGILQKIAPLSSDLVKLFLEDTLAEPIISFRKEREETAPDMFTGASYSYPIDKMILLIPYQNKKVTIFVHSQNTKSTPSKKSVILGNDQNWNYVYSNIKGGTDPVAGALETHIYNSAMVLVFVEKEPNKTEVLLFKWLRAGWLRVNVVSAEHIYKGSKRVLYSINEVFSNPSLPSQNNLREHYTSLKKLSTDTLDRELKGYSDTLSQISLKNPILKEVEFQKILKNGAYSQLLSDEEKVSLLMLNYMKEKINKPIL
ncbi:MAG: hypothetical protein ACRCV3_05365 [Desulfovibrionaceae bacterium]